MHLIIVAFGILLLVALISWGKVNAFLAFLVVSVTVGALLGIPPGNIAGAVYKGIGDTLGELKIVLSFSMILICFIRHDFWKDFIYTFFRETLTIIFNVAKIEA